MKALLALFPFIALAMISGGAVSGVLVALAVSSSSVYLVSSSGYLYEIGPYSPPNIIGYLGNVSSISTFQGSLYVLKDGSLYLFKNHSLHFLTKVSSFHPPYYVKNGSLYLLNGKKVFSDGKYFFHGSLALCVRERRFYLFSLGNAVLSGTLPFFPEDFYYNGSLYLLGNSFLYLYRGGSFFKLCKVPNAFFIYYSNSSCVFLKGYEYNGKWNVSLLEIVSKSSGKLLTVIPCSWFQFPYMLSQGKVINLKSWKTISSQVIKVDFNGKALVMLHANSTLEILSKGGKGWVKLSETPALIKAVGRYCFAYFLLISHKMSYVALYAPSHMHVQKNITKGGKVSSPLPTLSALIFLAVLIGIGISAYYVFRRRRLLFFLPFLPLRLSEANRAISPIAPAAPTIIITSLRT